MKVEHSNSLPSWIESPQPEIYTTGTFVVVDFETTNEEKGSPYNKANQLVLACWYTSWDRMWHYKWGDELEQQELLSDLDRANFFVAQNAKFELGWLDRCGVDLRDTLMYDTMLAEWVLLGNRKLSLDLDSMLHRRGLEGKHDVVAGMIALGVSPLNIPKHLLQFYCCEDVRCTLELFQKQLEELQEKELLHLVYSRCLLTPVLVDIEKTGVTLDKESVLEEWYKQSQKCEEAKSKLEHISRKWGGEAINFDSPKQLAALLYEKLGFEEVKDHRGNAIRTDSGAPSTSADVLARLRAKTPDQKQFVAAYLDFSESSARLSKFLNFAKEVVENRDGTFYGVFNQATTGTHRLSSSGRTILQLRPDGKLKKLTAQLQNMPREYKRLVRAKLPGWEVCDSDGSQLEFRVAGDLGEDTVAEEEISNYIDIHSITAEALTAAGEPTNRQDAKSRTFRPLYGGTSGSPAEQAYCAFFQNKYKGIYETQKGWTYEVLKTGQLRTPYGMIFYWPGTKLLRSGFITNTTSIFNYPVQGFATGEIIPITLFCLWHRLRGWDVKFTLTIHDSIVMEIGPDVDREKLKELIAKAFTEDVYDYLERCYGYVFKVPLGCGIKIGQIWGSGPEIQAQMFNNKRQLLWREKK